MELIEWYRKGIDLLVAENAKGFGVPANGDMLAASNFYLN